MACILSVGQGFTHCLSLDLASKDELELYSKHPLHLAFVENVVKPNVDDGASVLAMDIEI